MIIEFETKLGHVDSLKHEKKALKKEMEELKQLNQQEKSHSLEDSEKLIK